jgi:PH (Pleckstrin Homology) domain-containing protein
VLMAIVMGWVAPSRHRARPVSEARRLVHPPSTLIIGLTVFAFFFGIAIVSNVYANKTATALTTAVFLGFAALALWLVVDYVVARHEVSDEGLSHRSLLGRRDIKWAEVSSVRYSLAMKWFRLETRAGRIARVSVMLVGLPEFARLLLAKVPPGAIEPQTVPVLEATAAGEPPSVWG